MKIQFSAIPQKILCPVFVYNFYVFIISLNKNSLRTHVRTQQYKFLAKKVLKNTCRRRTGKRDFCYVHAIRTYTHKPMAGWSGKLHKRILMEQCKQKYREKHPGILSGALDMMFAENKKKKTSEDIVKNLREISQKFCLLISEKDRFNKYLLFSGKFVVNF